MTSSHVIAVWLFEYLGLDAALTGDLLEERQRGRSAIWYWRQVLIAVWGALWGPIRDHKLLALRAVATGFAIEYVFIFAWKYLSPDGPDLPLISVASVIANLSLVLLTQTATSWVVARTNRLYQFPMVFAYLICCLLWFFGPQLFWVREMMMDWDRIDPRAHPYLAYFFLTVLLTIVGILLGSILAHPRKTRSAPSDPTTA
jgi:hypothetical protein